ncbi:hypothetical protein TFLX_03189 [Thermoflexales bacterium]|nr:hypothetical protein TFLX_03189 [Thermoflexales bacterium]
MIQDTQPAADSPLKNGARRDTRGSAPFAFHVSRRLPAGWHDLLALAFLALLTVLFFWPVFFAGYWLPQGGGDLVSFLWPQYSFAGEAIRNGSLPLWNPYLYSGAPFLADNQAGVLYPINLLAFLISPNLTYQVMEGLVIFHIWLAGAAMYVALRVWPHLTPQPPLLKVGNDFQERGSTVESRGGRTLPALLGAIAFMFNDVLITHIGNLNLIAVAAWLPLILALYARGLSERRASWVIGSGVVFAVALFAGHAQMTAITLVGLMAVAVWQIALFLATRSHSQHVGSALADNESRPRADSGGRRAFGKLVGLALLAPLMAFGLTALQLLPSLEMTQYSLRAGLAYEEATAYSLPPAALASTFSPLLFGRGAAEFWGPWERVETMYVGVVPLLLAGFALRRKRPDGAWFLAALGLLGLLIALGKYTPIYSLVHSLPVLGGLRVPARFILLTNFSLAALAALGLQRLITEAFPLKRVLGWGGAVLIGGMLALIAAYQVTGAVDRSHNLTAAFSFLLFAGVALVILCVTVKSKTLAPRCRAACSAGVGSPKHLHRAAAQRAVQVSAGLLVGLLALELILLGSGVEIDRNDPTLGYQHQAVVDFLKSAGGVFRLENASNAWQPDAALLHHLNDIGGIFNPLGLAGYETYRGGMGNRGSPLYNFLGVKYVLANKDQPPGDASFVPVFNGDPQLDVYLNTNALPRAQLIDRVIGVSSGEEAWQAIHAPDFDPAQAAVIEGVEDRAGGGDQSAGRALAFAAISNERVELIARTDSATYLVLSDVYYPGWTATIDDHATTLSPANFAFRAVWVPPGEHRVAFSFEPPLWRVGLGISVITLLGLLSYAVWLWQQTRKR